MNNMETTRLDLTLIGWRAYAGIIWFVTSSVITLVAMAVTVIGVVR